MTTVADSVVQPEQRFLLGGMSWDLDFFDQRDETERLHSFVQWFQESKA